MEKLDDVLGYSLKIYQDKDWFCFSLDSVLIANFVPIKLTTKKIMDLGTGNAIIPLILSLRTNSKIYGVDIQDDLVKMANKSVSYNNLDDQISISNCDIKSLVDKKKLHNTFDLVVSNPPYFNNVDNSTKNMDIHKTIARHEIMIKLEDIFNTARLLLKDGGTFSIINRTDRLMEILSLFKKYKIEPKKIKFIYKNKDSESTMVYIEGLKNGKEGLKILSPFFVYNLDGTNSIEYSELCEKVL